MPVTGRKGLHRREFLAGAGALAGTAIGGFPARAAKRAGRAAEIVFASAPFLSSDSMNALIKTFNSAHPKIHVTYRELPSAADPVALHAQLLKLLKGKQAPDVFSLDLVRIAEFADRGHLLRLDTDFGDDMSTFFTGIVAGCTVGGALMAMPWFIDCGMLFYRSDILDRLGAKAPETWMDLVTAAKEGMDAETPHGFLWQGKKSEALVCNIVSVVGSNGGTILAADGKTVRIAEPEAIEAVKFLHETISDTKISPADVLTWDEEPSRKSFNDGKALFLRNWSYTWGLAQQQGSAIAGKIGVAPLPHFPGKPSAACLGGYQYGVNRTSREKKAAVEFLRFMSSAKTQLRFATVNGLAPPRRTVFDDASLGDAQPFLVQLKDVFAGAIARPVTPKYAGVTEALQAEIATALKTGEVEKALASAKSKIEAVLAA